MPCGLASSDSPSDSPSPSHEPMALTAPSPPARATGSCQSFKVQFPGSPRQEIPTYTPTQSGARRRQLPGQRLHGHGNLGPGNNSFV
jgi:hypothetical protein